MKRIGLTQRVEEVPGYRERRDCLDQEWVNLLSPLGYLPIPLPNQIIDVDRFVTALQLDGVILTGGNDLCGMEGGSNFAPERDEFEHLLLDVCAKRELPVLGVCRGLQLMNVHYGGSIAPVHGHVNQSHQLSLAQDFFGGSGSAQVNSYHQFGFGESGRASVFKALAWADDGSIEAVVHEALPQFGIMWHPERDGSPSREDQLIIRAVLGGKSQ